MSIEIERKFLVTSDAWRDQTLGCHHIKDYLVARFETGKARIRVCDDQATLTIKGNRTGFPAASFISICHPTSGDMISEFPSAPSLEKRRHDIQFCGLLWQVDEYLGALAGLVTCDVELPHERHEFPRPSWAGRDITHDSRYSSAQLTRAMHADGFVLADF